MKKKSKSPIVETKPVPKGKSNMPKGCKETTLKFCPHNELLAHLGKGWVISDELHGTNHGHWSVLLEWRESSNG